MKKSKGKLITVRSIVLALVALILGYSVYIWNAENLVGDKLPMPLGVGLSVVLTGSMEPELSEDDLILITRFGDRQVGDIVVFQEGNALIIHRIVKIDGDQVITKGDANNTQDAPIKMEDIKGELVFAIPYAGRVVDFLKQPLAIIAILGTAVLLLERSFRMEKDKDADELKALMEEIKRLKED